MKISDSIDARIRHTQEIEGQPGSNLRMENPEGPSDRLDLRYRAFGKVVDRLSPEGLSAMGRLLNAGPTVRRNDLRRLIAGIGTEEDEADRGRHRRRRDPFDALDRVMDAGSGGMGNLFDAMQGMSPEDQQAFLQTLSGLLKRGVMGYEYRQVNGQPRKVYLENEMGSDIHRAKLYTRHLNITH